MSKEPGQLAYETWASDGYPWERTPHKLSWARVESAIRADEAAKIIEALVEPQPYYPGRWTTKIGGWSYPSKEAAIEDLRAKIGAEHG